MDQPSHPMDCLRCGICCTRHQAIVSYAEAQKIAADLGITMREWELAYADPRWPGTGSYLIRHTNGICVFLKYDGDMSYCDIQSCKPACCADWVPSTEKKECRQSLGKYVPSRKI